MRERQNHSVRKSARDPGQAGDAQRVVNKVLNSPGAPLNSSTRATMETYFNNAVGHEMLSASPSPPVSGSLQIGPADDRYEQQADQIGERVMRTGPARNPARGAGHDFSQVRVHTGARAAESAAAVGALAYTVGRDIVFGAGQFAPGTYAGQRLLAHELTHVAQRSGPILRRALVAPPKKFINSTPKQLVYPTDDEATLDRQIGRRQAEVLDPGKGVGMWLGTAEYHALPPPAPAQPANAAKSADDEVPAVDNERRAVKSAVLQIISDGPSAFADSEFRLRVPLDGSFDPRYAMVILRFDEARNFEATYAGVTEESKGSLADASTILSELAATYTITFLTTPVVARMPNPVNFAGKEWSANDAALLNEALPLLGAAERTIISGKIFRRIARANYNGHPGFYDPNEQSVNLMDDALPWDKTLWFGEGGQFYSRAVNTVAHEIGHALSFTAMPATGAAAPAGTFMDQFKAVVRGESQRRTGRNPGAAWPPASIKFPTDYAATAWDEFYAVSYSIYLTNPSFFRNVEYQYLSDFFTQNFP